MLLGNGWNVMVCTVTPQMAEEYLEMNSMNRRARPAVVSKYATTMKAGSWNLTPEAICFSEEGILMNGQHRLMAVIKSGVPTEFLIISGVAKDVFKSLDRGATRSVADSLGIDKRLAEVAKLLAVVSIPCKEKIIDADVEYAAEIIASEHQILMDFCPSSAKVFSSAPIRLAACVRMIIDNDKDYILSIYRNMVLSRIMDLPPVAQSFCSSVFSGRTRTSGAGGQYDLLARGMKLFDKKNAGITKILIRDTATEIKEAKELFVEFRA